MSVHLKNNRKFNIAITEDFSFFHTISSHGWSSLAPFEVDEMSEKLTLAMGFGDEVPATVEIAAQPGRLTINSTKSIPKDQITGVVKHILRLDDDLSDFYLKTSEIDEMKWIGQAKAGRLIRSPTVFEDLIKTMCTTNCSWAMTKIMVNNIVSKLGPKTADGRSAFPHPENFKGLDEAFYRSEIKAGYRSPYFVELIEKVLAGEVDPEKWLTSDLPTPELKKEIKTIKGIGDYAADNLLKLLGRYDGLALDSWLRAQFYKKHKKGRKCPDKTIARHYKKFGEYQGLAIWCDMTKEWFDAAEQSKISPA